MTGTVGKAVANATGMEDDSALRKIDERFGTKLVIVMTCFDEGDSYDTRCKTENQ
jgi:hypothetical protein